MRRRAQCVAALLIAAAISPVTVTAADAAGQTLEVDVTAAFRPVTHAASGGLYALAEGDRPADSTLLPIRMHTITQPPPGVQQRPNGQPPGGDSLKVAAQADRVGAAMIIRLPDIYPTFPYQWVSWDDWLGKVDTMVNARLAATSVGNVRGYELWNEPDFTWDTARAGSFEEGWVRTFRRVRARDRLTPIVGPSITHYDEAYLRSFLTHARDRGALPDVICWHELSQTSAPIAAHVAAYRDLERSLGISARPIVINEYAWTDEVDVPGTVAGYVAKLERAGVESADRAFWHEYGTVNGLVTGDDQPTGTWWLYKWYGDMAGTMVTTTPPAPTGLDGFAAYEATRRIVNVVLGGGSGTNAVRLSGLSALGNQARVLIESAPDSGRFTAVPAPTTVSDTVQAVRGGTLTVQVPNMDARHVYHVVLRPVTGVPSVQLRYEAENAAVFRAERLSGSSASNGGYVGRIDNSGDPRTDSYVDFIVNVPAARDHTMTIRYANGTGAASTHGLAVNGGAWSTVGYPPTAGWGNFASISTTIALRAGFNVIRLAKGAPHFSGGTGFAELDYIELT